MLLIPDIHIHHKYADAIIHHIDTYISSHPQDNDIVFLGDYIYMFNLDSQAIHKLLDIILKWFHAGKNIYILAGNHDRIGNEFVYHQAAKIFDILNKHTDNKIHFITEPMITNIGDKVTLFLPYMISQEFMIHDHIAGDNIYINEMNRGIDESGNSDNILDQDTISQTITNLTNHKNHNQQMSGLINQVIKYAVDKYEHIDIIHHYYTADIYMPGVKSKFSYGDVAIMPSWLENKNINLISGHIHKAFQLGNYFCAGSIWHTASQESDQIKFLWQYNNRDNIYIGKAVYINPYIELELQIENNANKTIQSNINLGGLFEYNEIKSSETTPSYKEGQGDSNLLISLQNRYQDIYNQTKNLFGANVELELGQYDANKVTISLNTDMSYEDLQNSLTEETRQQFADIKIKKKHKTNKIQEIDISNVNLEYSYASRQQIAKKYISDKYGERSDIYMQYLQKMNIGI